MRTPRYAQAPLVAYVVLFLTCVTLFVGSVSCNKHQRTQTIRASIEAVSVARDQFTAWDRQHQQDIAERAASREAAIAELERYHARRARVLSGLEVTYRVLALAATQTDQPSLQAALEQAARLITAIQDLIGGGP